MPEARLQRLREAYRDAYLDAAKPPNNAPPFIEGHYPVGGLNRASLSYRCVCGGHWQMYGTDGVHRDPLHTQSVDDID